MGASQFGMASLLWGAMVACTPRLVCCPIVTLVLLVMTMTRSNLLSIKIEVMGIVKE